MTANFNVCEPGQCRMEEGVLRERQEFADNVSAHVKQLKAERDKYRKALERIELQNLDGLIECPRIAREALK